MSRHMFSPHVTLEGHITRADGSSYPLLGPDTYTWLDGRRWSTATTLTHMFDSMADLAARLQRTITLVGWQPAGTSDYSGDTRAFPNGLLDVTITPDRVQVWRYYHVSLVRNHPHFN